MVIAASSPPRDRFVDTMRAGALLTLVAQAWLAPTLSYDDGVLAAGTALATSGAWGLTWIGQVMPLAFFAAGAGAAYSLRRHQGSRRRDGRERTWLGRRMRRLAGPLVPVLAVCLPIPYVLRALDVTAAPLEAATRPAEQLLWYLGIFMLVMLFTPALVRLHRRSRGVEVVIMAAGAVVVDVLRFGMLDGAAGIGYLNVVLVWAGIYQVGIAYGCGALREVRVRRALALAVAAAVVVAASVMAGPYPAHLVNLPGQPVSATHPPTALLLAVAAAQLAPALALRPAIQRWASGAPVAHGLDYLSARTMTVYAWHLPALVVVTGVAVVGLGWSTPEPFTAAWRSAMPVWLAGLVLALSVFVRMFFRFEAALRLSPPLRDRLTGSSRQPEREKVGP